MLHDEPGIAIALLRKKRDASKENGSDNEDYMARMDSLESRVDAIEKKLGLRQEVESNEE